MKIFLIIIFNYIYPCVLRKKRHCLERDLLEGRMHPDTCIEIEEFVQSTEPKKPRSSLVEASEDYERYYYLGHPLYYSPNELNESEKVNKDTSNIEQIVLNPESIPPSNRDISKIENIVTDKNLISDQIEESFKDIKKYMEIASTERQLAHYLPRLENLKTSYKFIIDNEEKFKTSCSIFERFDTKLIEILDNLYKIFNPDVTINKNDYDKFKRELHIALLSNHSLRFLKGQIRIQSNDDIKLLFYAELKNCARKISLIPELMTLGGTFSGKSFDFIIVLIRAINLFIEKRKDNPFLKSFVVFLVKRAFESSKNAVFDLFSINKLVPDCPENQHDLYFFIWEMNNSKRKDLKFKYFYNEVFHYSTIEKKHFRNVLLIFLYQQIILLKCNNASYEELKRYTEFIKRVIKDDKCPDCDYDEFLKLLGDYP